MIEFTIIFVSILTLIEINDFENLFIIYELIMLLSQYVTPKRAHVLIIFCKFILFRMNK